MKVCIANAHETRLDADFFIRTEPDGTKREARMGTDFAELAPYISAMEQDLAGIAAGLFECEGLLRDEEIRLDDELSLVLCQGKLADARVKKALADLISFTLLRNPKIEFHKSVKQCAKGSGRAEQSLKSVCLFSGGVDSLSGILKVSKNLSPTAGAFVSHDRMAKIVQLVERGVLADRRIPIHKVWIQRNHHGFQQMRGFAYLTVGAIVAKLHGTDSIVISETGQTMFLPPMAALDEVTVTTHPTLIGITKSMLREAYGIDFKVYEPFSNATKAEVVSVCEAKALIPSTNSCITTQFANAEYSHCGECYGCLVRRVGCLVAGVEDARYAKDTLVKPIGSAVMGRRRRQTIKPENLANLQAMMRFSRDILEGQLDEAARLKIASFRKEDLYRRAALDVMAAMYLLYGKSKQGRNPVVRKFYEECENDGLVTRDIAETRISDVREQKFRPDFSIVL